MGKTQSIDSLIQNELKKGAEYAAEYAPYRGTMSYEDFGNLYKTKQDTISYLDQENKNALAAYGQQQQITKNYAQGIYDRGVSYAENMRDLTYKSAEQQRAQAYRDADLSYQRNAADAQAARYLESAYYGAKGEQLARMGLGDSGYSDYLEAQAYATSRAEAQAAARYADAAKTSARDAETNAKLNADMTYNSYINSAENDRDKAFADADLTYSRNALAADQKANEGKMNAELQYRSDLSAAKDKNISNYAAYLQMVNSGDYSKDMLYMMGKTLGLTDQQIAYANGHTSESGESKFDRLFGAGQYNDALVALNNELAVGDIDSVDYKQKTKDVINAVIQNTASEKYDENAGSDQSALRISMIYLDGNREALGESEYNRLKKELYKKYYGIKETNGRKYDFVYAGSGTFRIRENGKEHNAFRTSVAPDSVAKNLENVVNGKDFYMAEYDGNVYIYYDSKWRKVESQNALWDASNYLKTEYFSDNQSNSVADNKYAYYYPNTDYVSEGEFNRSSSMQDTYGTYANYIASKRK